MVYHEFSFMSGITRSPRLILFKGFWQLSLWFSQESYRELGAQQAIQTTYQELLGECTQLSGAVSRLGAAPSHLGDFQYF